MMGVGEAVLGQGHPEISEEWVDQVRLMPLFSLHFLAFDAV